MRYYVIAGEASGDLHGSNLLKEIQKIDLSADIRCWGGDLMKQAGGVLVKHYRELAFMGFVEVLANLRAIFRNLQFCKEDILQYKPDVVILIDYPGFNMRIAKWAKKAGIKTVYYISPQVWAWKEGRVRELRKTIDKMLVILPFEKAFYEQWNYEVEYVGHPLVQLVEEAQSSVATMALEISSPLNEKNIIALLPGSRKQEVAKKLPIMLELSKHFPDHRFVIAKAPSLDDSFYQPYLEKFKHVRSIRNKTYELLIQSKAALVTSGTATLETALFGVPQVVCYKGSEISYQIAKRVIRVKYISLVNLIMDEEIVKELIQTELTVENLRSELSQLLQNGPRLTKLRQDYQRLWNLLKKDGNASAKAARSVVNFVKSTRNEKQPHYNDDQGDQKQEN